MLFASAGGPADVERDSVPLRHFLILSFVVPLIHHVVRDFQIAFAVPGFFAHHRIDGISLQPFALYSYASVQAIAAAFKATGGKDSAKASEWLKANSPSP